ncbi:MAG TPA: chaplin family protein [Asanoa sp.]|nr:chaplin family protein [Asanoa sp.]
MTITRRRRLANAALPTAGLAVVAGALALTGQAASAAAHGDAAGLGETGDPAAAAADRAQAITDQAKGAADRALADVAPVALPASSADDGAPDDEGADGPADLPAAAMFGSGVSHISSGHNAGILNGTQVVVPVTIDVNVCGNSLAGLGGASASCGDDEDPPADEDPPVDEEPPPPTAQEEPPPVPLPTPVDEPVAATELPKTGLPVGSIAGLGGLLTAGGAAMQMAGVRGGRYTGRHRRRPSPA